MVHFIQTQAEFTEKVLGADAGVVVAVDYTASWCGPCKMIGPKFEKMAEEFSSILCFKVDVDENDEVAGSQGISAMPTFKFYKGGKQVDEMVGASEPKLRELFEKYAGNSQKKS